jgi:hypothetical protein
LVKKKLSTAWNMIIPYTPQYTDDNYQIIYSNPRTNQTHQQGFSGWDSHQHIMFLSNLGRFSQCPTSVFRRIQETPTQKEHPEQHQLEHPICRLMDVLSVRLLALAALRIPSIDLFMWGPNFFGYEYCTIVAKNMPISGWWSKPLLTGPKKSWDYSPINITA